MPVNETRKFWAAIFTNIIPKWQEARNRSRSGLEAMDYTDEIGAGTATYTKSTAKVRPSYSDFVADVEIAARRALNPEELAYFNHFYRDLEGNIDEVDPMFEIIDKIVREKLGKRLEAVKIYPLHEYAKGVDVRNLKVAR